MTTIVTRTGKGAPLTWSEADDNFTNLNGAVITAQNTATVALAQSTALFTNVSIGAVPASGGGTTNFLRADGTWTLPAGTATNITYTTATRTINSSSGTGAVLPLVASGAAGLAPASGGGTTNFLRADGSWAAPPGGAGGTPGGSSGQVQWNNDGAFGASADFTWNNTSKVLYVNGDLGLGVPSPVAKLDVAGSLYTRSTNTGVDQSHNALVCVNSDNSAYAHAHYVAAGHRWFHGGTEIMRTKNLNFGIKQTDPLALLHVGDNTTGAANAILATGNSDPNFKLVARNGYGTGLNSEHALFALEYWGGSICAGFAFDRGDSTNGSMRLITSGSTRADITKEGVFRSLPEGGGGPAYEVGFRDVISVQQNSNFTFTSQSRGKGYYAVSGSPNYTIPPGLPEGTIITVYAVPGGATINVVRGSGVVLYKSGTSTNNDWTVGQGGLVTLWHVGSNTWVISGTGI